MWNGSIAWKYRNMWKALDTSHGNRSTLQNRVEQQGIEHTSHALDRVDLLERD